MPEYGSIVVYGKREWKGKALHCWKSQEPQARMYTAHCIDGQLGRFSGVVAEFKNLPPGDYTVTTPDGTKHNQARVIVHADDTAEVDWT